MKKLSSWNPRLVAAALVAATGTLGAAACDNAAEDAAPTRLYMDRHHLGAGNVTAAAVAQAHEKDLAVQGKHGVRFLRYWVDEEHGDVYCLAEAPDAAAITATHAEAHGLLPDVVGEVTQGE